MQRCTKQRTGIIDFLMDRHDHPTADVIYTEMRKRIPNISLGTVYRNLNSLSESGEILKLRFDDGLDHFDANTKPHHHFICRDCGAVEDIYGVEESIKIPQGNYDGEIDGHFIYFYGKCPKCKSNQ